MLSLIFIIVVIIGFIMWFLATFPNVPPYAERTARGFFLLAALLWAYSSLHGDGR